MATRRKSSTNDRLRDGAHQRIDAVADSLDSIRASAESYVEDGRERVTGLAESFEDAVRERPVTAILIGAGVGFLVGCFMCRR